MKTIKQGIFLALLALLVPTGVWAQYDDEIEGADTDKKPEYKEDDKAQPDNVRTPRETKLDLTRMFVGGMIGFAYTDFYVTGFVRPTVSYEVIDDQLQFGTGALYNFIVYPDEPKPNQSHVYGFPLFGRVYIFRDLFAQLEYEMLNGEVSIVDASTLTILGRRRETFHTGFAGAGYRVEMGDNAYFTIVGKVNLNENLVYYRRFLTIDVGVEIGLGRRGY